MLNSSKGGGPVLVQMLHIVGYLTLKCVVGAKADSDELLTSAVGGV